MIDVTIEKLQADLKVQTDNVKGLIIQLDAVKGMLNDNIAQVLNLRINVLTLQQDHMKECQEKSKLLQEKNELQNKYDEQNAKMSVMAAAIIEMQAKLEHYEPPCAKTVLDGEVEPQIIE